MVRFVEVAGCTEGVAPVLVQPVRLFIVTMLAHQRWHEFASIREALGLTTAALSKQLGTLRKAGHVETRQATDARRSDWRLTPAGAERLIEHVEALHRIVTTTAEIVASLPSGSGEPSAAEYRPARGRDE
jgi:DNA-binding MarR family transcriptional regulator